MQTHQQIKTVSPRPFVKWVGGKTQLLPQLAKYLPDSYDNYYEPFLGGGALFFYLKPEIAHINDLNKKLIGTYKIIKNKPRKLIDRLQSLEEQYHSLSEEQRREFYYEKRVKFNTKEIDDLSYAELLIFLNKTGFNGMYRENSKGEFNVPFGSYKNPKICDETNLINVSKMLQGVSLTSKSYKDAVKDAKKGDFVYLDPPYHPVNTTSSFTSYSGDNFNAFDQENLRDLFVELDKRGCKVMLSNSYTPFIKELYKDFNQKTVMAGRSINSKASGRGKIEEIVVINY